MSDLDPTPVQSVLDSLAKHRALGAAPLAEHRWLAEHGTVQRYEFGDIITRKDEEALAMLIVFTGHLVIRADRGAGVEKLIEWKDGDVGGMMPYSRGAKPPGDVVAEEPTRLLAIDKDLLHTMPLVCPKVTTVVVHLMLDRVRRFKVSDLRTDKLVSLGKVAAGLAHELNNPASAVIRSARLLRESVEGAAVATRQLGALRLSASQLDAIDRIREECMSGQPVAAMSSIDRADNEDALADWLVDHGADEAHASALAETSLTTADLDALASHVEGEALEVGLRWLAADCQLRTMAADIESAAIRIRDLVDTVKRHSYMDRALTAEPVDIRKGIAETLTLLESKRREKSVQLVFDVPVDLPKVNGVGGELNQVWMNLIDNAYDAVGVGGTVAISATHESGVVIVSVADDGPGVPQEIRERIFEPFFSTKGVGKGTGLGLDTVKRLLQQHEGGIELETESGMTEFLVRLPVRAP